jgi:hypothetical protein
MRRQATALLLLFAIIFAGVIPARPYTFQFTDSSASTQIKWPGNTITIAFSTSLNSPPASIKAGSDTVGAARRALAHWAEAANIQFIETTSSAQSISPQTGGDGISLITVADTPENSALFSGERTGRTRVFFDPTTGGITEADIVINPHPLNSQGQPVQFSTDGSNGTYDLEATLTHELGHLLGLEHSGVIGATMQPLQGTNGIYSLPALTARTLSEDDRAGARTLYGPRTFTGAISGTVSYPGGAPAYGAHVWAEETTTGRVIAGNVSFSNGTYRIESLPAGQYRIVAEYLDGPILASQIASSRGAYTNIANSAPFRTTEVQGQVSVGSGTTPVNIALGSGAPALNPRLLGTNAQLSTVPVPIEAGRSYTLYVGGEGVDQIPGSGISITSPYMTVNPASLIHQQFGTAFPIISFDVAVSASAPAGDYSIRLQSNAGEVAYLSGGLTIEANGSTVAGQWEQTTLTADQVEIRTWTQQNGISYALVKLTFPNGGYRLADIGQVTRSGNTLTVNARVERFTGASVQALTTTAQIYELGTLAPGTYTFNFQTSGTLARTQDFTVSAQPPPTNPIDDARTFVRQHYLDFLNREPDTAGWDFWTDNITLCNNSNRRPAGQTVAQCIDKQRTTTSAAFFLSPEFQYTGYYVYRVYKGSLGRIPKLSEFLPDVQQVAQGIIVNGQLSGSVIEQNKRNFAIQFVQRAEFQAIYGGLSNDQYVNKLFETTGVQPTDAERDELINGLSSGAESRASVLQKIVDGIIVISEGNQQFTNRYGQAFYQKEFNPAFVVMQYFGYMRRDPDDAGYNFWLGKLNFYGNYIDAEMVRAFILSPEYRSRFGQP